MKSSLCVVTLWAENVPETVAFYRDIIGLELMPHHGPDRVHLKMGENLYLVILKGKPSPATETTIERFPVVAFRVNDLDEAIAELNSKGVDLPPKIEEDAVSRWVFIHDPGGNLIEIAEFVKTPFA
ncbi:MAG: VOC family protein [candidate division Zixibacteria bacterium]